MSPVFENVVNFLLAVVFVAIFALMAWVVLKLFERPIDTFINWLYLWGKSRREGLTVKQIRAKMAEEDKLHQEQIDQIYRDAGLSRPSDDPSAYSWEGNAVDPFLRDANWHKNIVAGEDTDGWHWVDKSERSARGSAEENDEDREDTTDTK